VTQLDTRSRLFFANTEHGVFLLKAGDIISDCVLEQHAWGRAYCRRH